MTTTGASQADRDRLLALDATGQAALVRTGEVTAADLLEASIARIEQVNPSIGAVVMTWYDEARAELASGLPDGPFTGVPFLVKDLAIEVAGRALTEGSGFLVGHTSTQDSQLVRRWRAAGLVLLGRSASCEMGIKPTVETRLYGATRNPWDLSRSTGGSSGGAAAAVAAGLVPMAHGNDVGGSIRIPASACGLFGLKPTRARVPLGPHYGDVFTGMDGEHALTRSVRDSAALLDLTSGPMLGDPYAVPAPAGSYLDDVDRDPGRLRIAFTTKPAEGRTPAAECVAAVLEAAATLESWGHEVFERDLVELTPEVGAAIGTVYGAGTAWAVNYWVRKLGRPPEGQELEPFTRALLEHARRVSGSDLLLAVTDFQAFTRRVATAMEAFDLWLSPTLGTPPPLLGEMVETDEDPWRGNEVAADLVSFPLVTANITGHPAMSVPWTLSEAGLPLGIHLMARYGREDVLFGLAGQVERRHQWPTCAPL